MRVPRLPGAGVALAAPANSDAPHAAVTMTTGAALNWREKLLRTIELTSLVLFAAPLMVQLGADSAWV